MPNERGAAGVRRRGERASATSALVEGGRVDLARTGDCGYERAMRARYRIRTAMIAGAAAASSLGACNRTAEPTADDAQLNAFMNKLDRDAAADRNSAIAQVRAEEARRAAEAEARLKDYSDGRRKSPR